MRYILLFIIFTLPIQTFTQEEIRKLTLEEVIQLAHDNSLQAVLAKHQFRDSYWSYRTYKAEFLPSLSLSTDLLNYENNISFREKDDGSFKADVVHNNRPDINLALSQQIGLTGGSISINSYVNRTNNIAKDTSSYVIAPISIKLTQPLNGHNTLRWKKKIEPVRYEEAKKNYIKKLEEVSIRAINLFFDMALSQVNLKIATINYANTDTLYRIEKGRFNMGTISESELFQMELQFLNAGLALNEANIELYSSKSRLRSFLGFNDYIDFELVISDKIPFLEISFDKALEYAYQNNPDILRMERKLMEAQRDVSKARAENRFSADLKAEYGLNGNGELINDAYSHLGDLQKVSIGLAMPIIDWGRGRGNYMMAKSKLEVERTSIQQDKIEFEHNVFLQVMRFNLQDDQLKIASKADTIAQIRYEAAKHRFLIGKIEGLDLNIAQSEKDAATRKYISALKQYWLSYHNIRSLTLFDFKNQVPLTEDIEGLL